MKKWREKQGQVVTFDVHVSRNRDAKSLYYQYQTPGNSLLDSSEIFSRVEKPVPSSNYDEGCSQAKGILMREAMGIACKTELIKCEAVALEFLLFKILTAKVAQLDFLSVESGM